MANPALIAVDDDPEVLRTVQRDLRRGFGDDYRVLAANSPDVALRTTEQLMERDEPVALYLVDASCLSETIGATTIEETLRATTAPLARAALRELLHYEVEHARMGWAFLGAPHLGGRHVGALGAWLSTVNDRVALSAVLQAASKTRIFQVCDPSVTGDSGAARPGCAPVACGRDVAEIKAARPLHQVATDRRHVADLRGRRQFQCLGNDGELRAHTGMGGQLRHPDQ